MAQIIDFFTRKSIPHADKVAPGPRHADTLDEFRRMATEDPVNLSEDDQEWFCSIFRDTFLADLTEAMRGIDESVSISDLEAFMSDAHKAIEAWPKVSRA